MKRALLLSIAILALASTPAFAGSVIGSADCNGNCDDLVVYLEGGPGGEGAGTSVVFDQKDKVFVPHVLPIVRGTTVDVTNNDPFLHNVHVYSGKKTVLNLAMPFPGQVIQHTFNEPGVYKVLCDAHPEMSAFIVVLESPHFAKPAADGSYEIAGVPAGSYTLVVADPENGTSSRSAVVVN